MRSASFNNFDTDAIFQMPLFKRDLMDCCIWNSSSDGKYSDKSAYSLCMRLIVEPAHAFIQGNWNAIWKPHVPTRVRSFLW